jgi:FkbM family methyltransferase
VWRTILERFRENFYLSQALRWISRPVYGGATFLSTQIPRKIKTNGVSVSLPNGKRMRFERDCGIGIASALYWHGPDAYEPATSKTLRFFFGRVRTFVDVGANSGLYSLLAGLWNPGIQVLAFEPEPRIYKCLLANVRRNDLAEQISCYQLALSDETGKAEFYLPPSQSRDVESTGTLAEKSWQSRKEHTTLQVDTVKFDDFEAARSVPLQLVKIDVEDAEAKVLSGMARSIARDRPLIICEILPRQHHNLRTLEVIRDLGYTAYWITSVGYVRVSNFEFERTAPDFLLSPRDGPEIVTDPSYFLH